ncbi:MAG TPA: hypothetical protein VK453_11430 [Micromonosporaceae bacterium]|nr:hypothetical protein [Micromonosporaceae bacterium]
MVTTGLLWAISYQDTHFGTYLPPGKNSRQVRGLPKGAHLARLGRRGPPAGWARPARRMGAARPTDGRGPAAATLPGPRGAAVRAPDPGTAVARPPAPLRD